MRETIYLFVQGNPLGKKPAPLSRLECAMLAQEPVVPSNRFTHYPAFHARVASVACVVRMRLRCAVSPYVPSLRFACASLTRFCLQKRLTSRLEKLTRLAPKTYQDKHLYFLERQTIAAERMFFVQIYAVSRLRCACEPANPWC